MRDYPRHYLISCCKLIPQPEANCIIIWTGVAPSQSSGGSIAEVSWRLNKISLFPSIGMLRASAPFSMTRSVNCKKHSVNTVKLKGTNRGTSSQYKVVLHMMWKMKWYAAGCILYIQEWPVYWRWHGWTVQKIPDRWDRLIIFWTNGGKHKLLRLAGIWMYFKIIFLYDFTCLLKFEVCDLLISSDWLCNKITLMSSNHKTGHFYME